MMKMKHIFLAATAILSFSAFAQSNVTLDDGTVAVVLTETSRTTTYLKASALGADGKVMLTPGTVFSGERVVKKADGECLKITTQLIGLDLVTVDGQSVQRPNTKTKTENVSCNS